MHSFFLILFLYAHELLRQCQFSVYPFIQLNQSLLIIKAQWLDPLLIKTQIFLLFHSQ